MGDEMELTKEELQIWIAERLHALINSNETVENCNHLQGLIERFQSQVSQFLDLCQSVDDFESKVKSLYVSLGLEYNDKDSDADGDDQSSSSVVCSQSFQQASSCLSPKKENQEDSQNKIILGSTPIVVLMRLPAWKVEELLKPKAQTPTTTKRKINSNNKTTTNDDDNDIDANEEDFSEPDDDLWQPGTEGDDSDHDLRPSKKRKVSWLLAKVYTKEDKIDMDYGPNSKMNRKVEKLNNNSTSKQPQKPEQTKPPTQTAAAATPAQNTSDKTTKDEIVMPVYMVTTLCQSTDTKSKVPRTAPHKDITVQMTILAQKSSLCWERVEVQELVEKEEGQLKYKVIFNDKKKTLLSSHHIALDIVPEPENLYVGARVVVGGDKGSVYRPGIVAETPSRKNHLRFLVFIDNQTTVYVSLTFIRLVYKPLEDPLDDLRNPIHKEFVKEYIQFWPCPPQIQYIIGQTLKVERSGEMQKCEVLRIDCSMVQVKFENDVYTEWLYRGSLRLDHMANLKKKWIEKSWSQNKYLPSEWYVA